MEGCSWQLFFEISTGVLLIHSSSILFHCLVAVVGFLATLLPRIFHRFSFGFRSLDRPFHYFSVLTFKELLYLFCSVTTAWKVQVDWEMLSGKVLYVLKEILKNICIHSDIKLYKRTSSSTFQWFTQGSVFPQFDTEHNVSHRTQINITCSHY